MDAHSRGRADEIGPAGRWVLNPQTGKDPWRLKHSGTEPSGLGRAPDDRPGLRGASASARATLEQGACGAEDLQAMVRAPGADFEGAGAPVTGPAKAPDDMQRASADKAERAK